MAAAARITDMHTCPMTTGAVPHVGGPLIPGANSSVLIGSLPASIVGDSCVCTGPPDSLSAGSSSVFIAGSPAVRMGDATSHGGVVVAGCPTVIIGG
ncbi:type VI secretion protein [Flavobacterium jejuense]|uniref:Type VI secretion protein n=1 Tax=Flavobacterium jejuense TaxID=1544455 RepID=A0ABX0IUE0_9FLAO|nr:PAAR domain-containing protein [Flavobacterium jejuense]NHN27093.1 type VI secretion protein [Flavobacterium jejuense]